MRKHPNPEIGQVFDGWTVIGETYYDRRTHRYVPCRCECGKEKPIYLNNLFLGKTKSCRCRQTKTGVPNPGAPFGRWTVTGTAKGRMVPCRCECGTEKVVDYRNLVTGRSTSCGCYRAENPNTVIHGGTGTRLHRIWIGMLGRCYEEYNWSYHKYGARGITVCQKWRESFPAFRDWSLANGYEDSLCIDRRNTHGNYTPDNCRWTTQKVNSRNARSNHVVTAFGESKCISEWAEDLRCKVKYGTLWKRINEGMKPEKAISCGLLQ